MFAAELRQELDKAKFVSVTTDALNRRAETPESGDKEQALPPRPYVRGQRKRRCLFIKVLWYFHGLSRSTRNIFIAAIRSSHTQELQNSFL